MTNSSDEKGHAQTAPIRFTDATCGIILYIRRCLELIWKNKLFQESTNDSGGVGICVAWPDDLIQVVNQARSRQWSLNRHQTYSLSIL